MSHCTKFDFQYTSRKIICRTFQTLGLDWNDDIVATYSSTLTKTLGICGKDKTPAIVAERDGFQYFMMNMGAYYELLMEKHNMTSEEANISKQLADEFKQTYIKEVAKEVVKQMNTRGENALLEETKAGYEIRFGQTYDKSILIKFICESLAKTDKPTIFVFYDIVPVMANPQSGAIYQRRLKEFALNKIRN